MLLDEDEKITETINDQDTLRIISSVHRYRTVLWKELHKCNHGTIQVCFMVNDSRYERNMDSYEYVSIHVPTQIKYDKDLKKRENIKNWTSIITESIINLLEREQLSYVRMNYIKKY